MIQAAGAGGIGTALNVGLADTTGTSVFSILGGHTFDVPSTLFHSTVELPKTAAVARKVRAIKRVGQGQREKIEANFKEVHSKAQEL